MASLSLEQRSHLVAEIRGYRWAASDAEVAQITLAEWYANVHRDRERSPEPMRFPRPWPDQEPAETFTDEERAAFEQKLLERSALRDR